MKENKTEKQISIKLRRGFNRLSTVVGRIQTSDEEKEMSVTGSNKLHSRLKVRKNSRYPLWSESSLKPILERKALAE
jgi:hypothetical protein